MRSMKRISTSPILGSSMPSSRMPSLTSTPYHSTGIFLLSYHFEISEHAAMSRVELRNLPNCGLKSVSAYDAGSSSQPLITTPRITGFAASLNVRLMPSRVSTVSGRTSRNTPVLNTRTHPLISFTVYEKRGLMRTTGARAAPARGLALEVHGADQNRARVLHRGRLARGTRAVAGDGHRRRRRRGSRASTPSSSSDGPGGVGSSLETNRTPPRPPRGRAPGPWRSAVRASRRAPAPPPAPVEEEMLATHVGLARLGTADVESSVSPT